MQRYFIELAYNGTRYAGWQRQPGAPSVQQTIEDTCSTILRTPVEITGCGRTDAGVHARQYIAHLDLPTELSPDILHRLNRLLPPDIVLLRSIPVQPEAHARFDAYSRSYRYALSFQKNPFELDTCYFYPYQQKPDPERMQQAAALLLEYTEFYPFCKSDHDAKTLHCALSTCTWTFDATGSRAELEITSNRFLRGMVRLIVGMCLQVGIGKISLEEVREALEHQNRLKKSVSAPPQGLFLTDIRYPFFNSDQHAPR